MDSLTNATGRSPSRTFWRGKRVLVTGHTGFKGSWLSTWLEHLGAEVAGLSLPEPVSSPNLHHELGASTAWDLRGDIARAGWQKSVLDFGPEIVFHLAAQALVPLSYSEPLRTFETNVQGSANLLDALTRSSTVAAAVLATTDKVYDTRQPVPFAEDAFFGGIDPYSASKAAMELVVHSWPGLGFPMGTARAGNVIGGGDWSADRLVPDLIRSWSYESTLILRRPNAVRPWQHVLEPLRGYLLYAELLATNSERAPRAVNLGPDEKQCVPVSDVVSYAADCWTKSSGTPKRPQWDVVPEPGIKETELLVLNSELARDALDWSNALDWRTTVRKTIEWHLVHANGSPARELVLAEIEGYQRLIETGR